MLIMCHSSHAACGSNSGVAGLPHEVLIVAAEDPGQSCSHALSRGTAVSLSVGESILCKCHDVGTSNRSQYIV